MESAGLTLPNFSTEMSKPNPTLTTNLSRGEQVDLKIARFQENRNKNYKRDLLRESLNLKLSVQELQQQIKLGQKQLTTTAAPVATSTNSLGLDIAGGDLTKPINQVSLLSEISSGKFVINGVNIAVDISSDSLNDVISRINSSQAGVTASFDQTNNKFSVTDDTSFILSNGNSKFFSALDITTGEILSAEQSPLESFFKSEKFVEIFKNFTQKLTSFFDKTVEVSSSLITETTSEDEEEVSENPYADDMKESLKVAITNFLDPNFEGNGKIRLKYGLTLSFENGSFADFDNKEFKRNIIKELPNFINFFNSTANDNQPKSAGFLFQMNANLTKLITQLDGEISSKQKNGLLIDTQA